jgi:TrmH family RNA methyltransferase
LPHSITNLTDQLVIVLCDTANSGNIGSAARAMKNMCVSQLVLVNPLIEIDDYAYARASHAADILDNVRVVSSLKEALNDTVFSIAMSARRRDRDALTPNVFLPQVAERLMGGNVAIVFGSERCGLSQSDCDMCNILATIPANPQYQSLNLSQAVQVMCYAVFNYCSTPVNVSNLQPHVNFAATDSLINKIDLHLLHANYYRHPNSRKNTLRHLYKVLYKANLDMAEVNLLHGIIDTIVGVS